MAACCSGQIGALNAESFCERVLSCANLVVDEGNALLDDKYITIMLVVLRMSRAFMEFMRANYSAVARSTFKTSGRCLEGVRAAVGHVLWDRMRTVNSCSRKLFRLFSLDV